MAIESRADVTQLLKAWRQGDAQALEELTPLIEFELRRVARAYLRRENDRRTLQPTELVNEAYLRLLDWEGVDWEDRSHFLAVAAKMMRRVLVNRAIARKRQKRGGSAVLVSLSHARGVPEPTVDLLGLDEALTALARFDERKCQVVELRFFSGLTVEQTATVLGISERTVHREWDLARAWLFRTLSQGPPEPPAGNAG